ncbi:putative tRNA-splicing endonuclease subunit tsp-1 [Colletotrichum gloeosporioides]|uniref:Putative tRNA-splicing endonuclease subunit tsp-1 n=1 Tax=Colletotrichum gloeosporioides TaxID=474922 RepID=A0A8H4FML6_COLGL|nr:putative tRNA-splicing endonuclease subunit tsp-1 [Colletotrichum gloeosporioides]KAF3806479.1 putative tRNA-splicing endonuclease subunit tsp-1 [Colletotrichum gloeosporioides]
MAVEQHLLDLTALVLSNLTDQHDWTEVQLHDDGRPRPRPVITGLPPTRLYIHPDEQIEILEKEQFTGKRSSQAPEFEWVLPVHLSEQWTLSSFANIFDSIDALPRMAHSADTSDATSGRDWRGAGRQKRLLLAVVHDDSTVSYYLMHEGIVKPRQN